MLRRGNSDLSGGIRLPRRICTLHTYPIFNEAMMRNSFIVAINQVVQKPVVKEGKIEVAPMLNLNFTLDHRFMDGGAVLKSHQAVRNCMNLVLGRLRASREVLQEMRYIFIWLSMNSFASRYGVALASAVKHCGNGSHNLIVMHGLLGQKRNFRTFANHQEITSQLRSIHLLDLRNHGESPHTSTMSLNEMADDLREYIDNHTLDNLIILGHSLGGRVLFKFMGNPDFS